VIVGFPGETDLDFQPTYDFLADIKPAFIHIFPFSERPGTPAVDMPNKVPPHVAAERVKRLEELCAKLHYDFCSKSVGGEDIVLFESTMRGGYMTGFTGNYVKVKVPYDRSLINSLSRVRITAVEPSGDAVGEIISV
jgi:threonylcarbamoyladenosine tRNA methylthiotransferase MtaB